MTAAGSPATRTVLAVEDSPVHLKIVTRYVEQVLGCRVVPVDGVETAVGALLRGVPDLIVSDLMMPNLDGLDLVQILAGHGEWSRIPIVILSAANHQSGIHALSECGVKAYILKPFDPAIALPRLQRVLAKYPPQEPRQAPDPVPVASGRIPILVVTRRAEVAALVARTAGPLYEAVTVESGPAAIVRAMEITPWLVFVCADVARWDVEKTRRGLLSLRAVPRVRVVALPPEDDATLVAAVQDEIADGPFTILSDPTVLVRLRDTFTTGCLGALRARLEDRVAQGAGRIVFEIPAESIETSAHAAVTALARTFRR